jgi:hypothetical protein
VHPSTHLVPRLPKLLPGVNQAYTILLCKKKDAKDVKDFIPVNLIHSLSKLIARLFVSLGTAHAHLSTVKIKCVHQRPSNL